VLHIVAFERRHPPWQSKARGMRQPTAMGRGGWVYGQDETRRAVVVSGMSAGDNPSRYLADICAGASLST
jgi:hypothetical protein